LALSAVIVPRPLFKTRPLHALRPSPFSGMATSSTYARSDIEAAAGKAAGTEDLTFCASAGRRAVTLRRAAVLGVVFVTAALMLYLATPPSLEEMARTASEGAASASAGSLQRWQAALPSGILMPPSEQPALDAYFKQMMGIPGTAKSQGNPNNCYDTEEEFQGLCYRKCSLLTNGTFGLRTSAWTCCSAHALEDCFVSNQDKNIGLCSGYDVAGDGQSCPRLPGKCMDNEEMFLGQCYEKCSILTNGEKPHRTSPFSCCATPMALSCFKPSNVVVGPQVDAGGGKGDGDAATPSKAHAPLKASEIDQSTPVAN